MAFYNPVPIPSVGFVASQVLKTSRGRILYLNAYNNNAAVRYLMLFDATALPANGTTPLLMQAMTATASIPKELAFPPEGMTFTNGLVIAVSSTAASLTLAGADLGFTAGVA